MEIFKVQTKGGWSMNKQYEGDEELEDDEEDEE